MVKKSSRRAGSALNRLIPDHANREGERGMAPATRSASDVARRRIMMGGWSSTVVMILAIGVAFNATTIGIAAVAIVVLLVAAFGVARADDALADLERQRRNNSDSPVRSGRV